MEQLETLRASLEQILGRCSTDEEIATAIAGSAVLQEILRYGTVSNEGAAQMLGYKSKRSVDSMAQKSSRFPQPVSSGVLWSRKHLREYGQSVGKDL